MQKVSKGFTIIELIVVIAIIAVLAAIVVTSVVIYIGRANDTAVKADLSQVAKKMYIHFAETSTYDTFTAPEIVLPCNSVLNITPHTTSFVAYAQLCTSENFWCVDSGGRSLEQSSSPVAGETVCSGQICSDCSANDCKTCSPSGVCESTCYGTCDGSGGCTNCTPIDCEANGFVCGSNGCTAFVEA